MKIKWTPEGLSEQQLVQLSSPPPGLSGIDPEFGLPSYTSWVAEIYGGGKIFREYGWYPKFLPICVQVAHSIAMYDEPAYMDLHHRFRDMFYFSERMTTIWKEYSTRPVSLMESPHSYYCRSRGVRKKSTAKGSVVFPAHDTHFSKEDTDYNKFIALLKSLPEEFQPVGVCMYWLDIQRGKHKIFVENGFPVYTAGHWMNEHFMENFYEILTSYNYSLSNLIGSYLYYSIGIDIPFSLVGDWVNIINLGNKNLDHLKNSNRQEWNHFSEVIAAVGGLRTEISPEARQLVRAEMGSPSLWHRIRFSLKLYKGLFWGLLIAIEMVRKKLMRLSSSGRD